MSQIDLGKAPWTSLDDSMSALPYRNVDDTPTSIDSRGGASLFIVPSPSFLLLR